jgi:hypothetical protein
MNERIRQLAKQSGFKVNWQHEDVQAIKMAQLTEFAELIVNQCEKVIRAEIAVTDIDSEVERAWEMGMECGVGLIKEHFGVKE